MMAMQCSNIGTALLDSSRAERTRMPHAAPPRRHCRACLSACRRTCNELNAGYAADGYCRRKGMGACVVT